MSDENQTTQADDSTAPGPEAPGRAPSSGGRTAGLIASSILGLFGLAILLAGLALIAVHAFARDDDGFYSTGNERFQSSAYALATDKIDLGASAAGVGIDDLGATVRLDASSADGRTTVHRHRADDRRRSLSRRGRLHRDRRLRWQQAGVRRARRRATVWAAGG